MEEIRGGGGECRGVGVYDVRIEHSCRRQRMTERCRVERTRRVESRQVVGGVEVGGMEGSGR